MLAINPTSLHETKPVVINITQTLMLLKFVDDDGTDLYTSDILVKKDEALEEYLPSDEELLSDSDSSDDTVNNDKAVTNEDDQPLLSLTATRGRARNKYCATAKKN